MNIEYNKPYKYKQMCEIMGELPRRGGKQRKNQLSEWNKKYTVIKDDSTGEYYISPLTKQEKKIVRENSRYSIYIMNILLTYLANTKNETTTLTYYELFEKLGMVNQNYHTAKNNQMDEIYKFAQYISDDVVDLYGTSKEMIVLSNLDYFFAQSRKQLKRLIDDTINKLEENNVLFGHKTYKFYHKPIKGVLTPPHVATDKEISQFMDIQNNALKQVGLKSKQQLIYCGNGLYNKYQSIVLKDLKLKMGYDSYSQAIKFVYGKNSINTESKYVNRLTLNQNIQDKLETAKSMNNILDGLKKEFIKEYIELINL